MENGYQLVAVKRKRCPEWLYRFARFAFRGLMTKQPLRAIFHRELSEREQQAQPVLVLPDPPTNPESRSIPEAIAAGCNMLHAASGDHPPGFVRVPGYFLQADGTREDAFIEIGASAPFQIDYLRPGESAYLPVSLARVSRPPSLN